MTLGGAKKRPAPAPGAAAAVHAYICAFVRACVHACVCALVLRRGPCPGAPAERGVRPSPPPAPPSPPARTRRSPQTLFCHSCTSLRAVELLRWRACGPRARSHENVGGCAGTAAFDADERDEEKEGEGVAVRDLDEGRDKKPKVIDMKQTGSWHKGRLGKKTSNADAIMEQVKKGGSVTAADDSGAKQPELPVLAPGGGANSSEEEARLALVKDALAERDRAEGEEKTLGLTIQTGNSSSRKLDEKIDLETCGEETKLEDYDDMPIAEFGMALMRGMGWKDGEALGGSRKGSVAPLNPNPQPPNPNPQTPTLKPKP